MDLVNAMHPERHAGIGTQDIATEVLELGQSLFDTLLAAATAPTANPSAAEAAPFPEEEIRATAAQFFAALRVLIHSSTSPE